MCPKVTTVSCSAQVVVQAPQCPVSPGLAVLCRSRPAACSCGSRAVAQRASPCQPRCCAGSRPGGIGRDTGHQRDSEVPPLQHKPAKL